VECMRVSSRISFAGRRAERGVEPCLLALFRLPSAGSVRDYDALQEKWPAERASVRSKRSRTGLVGRRDNLVAPKGRRGHQTILPESDNDPVVVSVQAQVTQSVKM
jgi:hypothetical protein